jgi:hypothetical protein
MNSIILKKYCLILAMVVLFSLKKIIVEKVCTACSREIYEIPPLTNLKKKIHLHNDTSETEVKMHVRVNNGSEKF